MEPQEKNTEKDHKPVGYGSSIQSSGYGNRNRPQKPIDKTPLPDPLTNEPLKEKKIKD